MGDRESYITNETSCYVPGSWGCHQLLGINKFESIACFVLCFWNCRWGCRWKCPQKRIGKGQCDQLFTFCFVGELQRKIGLKVLEMRGNAVVGYLQCFDLEGESGLVVRAIGTACTLDKLSNTSAFLPACNSPSKEMKE